MKKLCKHCGVEKDISDFRPNKSKNDGHQFYCKECDREFQRIWYSKNKEHVKKKSKISDIKYRERAREFITNYLKDHPCTICGENDINVLEFDHLRNKTKGVAYMVSCGFSLEKIKDEIDKCQVLCCNCHRRKTIKQLG